VKRRKVLWFITRESHFAGDSFVHFVPHKQTHTHTQSVCCAFGNILKNAIISPNNISVLNSVSSCTKRIRLHIMLPFNFCLLLQCINTNFTTFSFRYYFFPQFSFFFHFEKWMHVVDVSCDIQCCLFYLFIFSSLPSFFFIRHRRYTNTYTLVHVRWNDFNAYLLCNVAVTGK
jgi:hypothetical protein